MSNWIGTAVSVNCGEPLGCYQGTILEADGHAITLTKAFRNGFPYPKSQVTLKAADIKDLKIIESKTDDSKQTHSTVAVSKTNKKSHRATVCENLQANQTNTGNQVSSGITQNVKSGGARNPGQLARSKPIDIQGSRPNKNSHAGSFGNSGSTPKSRGGGGGGGGGGAGGGGGGAGHERARRRNEACFGESASPALADDFDFEGNLALFDRAALREEMLREERRPDLVRAAEPPHLRPDEHVLARAVRCDRPLRLPDELRAHRDLATDEGVRLPAAAPALRRRLWEELRRLRLDAFSGALLARAAADLALRLVGGGRRLEWRNAHQAPAVVALVGAHGTGAAGLAAARLLAAHGARAAALCVYACAPRSPLERELEAARLADVTLATAPHELPSADVVLLALHDPAEGAAAAGAAARAEAGALAWARASRAACVALEPPAGGWEGVAARASVLALAPAALAPSLGRQYLANVAPPTSLFASLGVAYRSPFGASSLLALHPADE